MNRDMRVLVILVGLALEAIISSHANRGACNHQVININQADCSTMENPVRGEEHEIQKLFVSATDSLLGKCTNLCAEIFRGMGNGFKPKDCTDIRLLGENKSGVYKIFPEGTAGFPVYCDMGTDGGNWTVIQRRVNGSVDFFLSWGDYLVGFGDLQHEFWLGNQQIHSIVSQGWYELRIDMVGPEDEIRYAMYDVFSIGDASTQFVLTIDGYHGDAGDDLSHKTGMKFSTKDRDNDVFSGGNCSLLYTGAWWYRACQDWNLNGMYGSTMYGKGITWQSTSTQTKSLKRVDMKVRKWQNRN